MNKLLKKESVVIIIFALISACTGKFEEINTNPNALTYSPHTNVLGNSIRSIASEVGGDMDGFGQWAGYIAKLQYPDDLGGVDPTNNSFGNRWAACYAQQEQLRVVLTKAEETAKNLRWACRIFQCYMWLYLIDQYGDIPYSEALQGDPALGGIFMPKYDSEKDIYPDVLNKLKVISDEMAAGFGEDEIGDGDFLFGGDVEKWQRFCNSLRLRGAMRLSEVSSALAKTHVEEIAGNPGRYPLIDCNDNNAYFWWANTSGQWERWYDNFRGRNDHTLYDTFIDYMLKMEDPRIQTIAKLAKNTSEDTEYTVYRGLKNGVRAPSNLSLYSLIGPKYRENPAGFTPLFQSCQTYYLLAEAAMLGWNVRMTAQQAYEKAVLLSMEDNDISDEEAEAYLEGKGKWDNTKARIYWDQWIALFKENMEAWCLYRRTGIPTQDINYVTIFSKYGDAHTSQPFRTPYPVRESLYNPDNYKAANVGIVDFGWGKQLWWDTRKGVK